VGSAHKRALTFPENRVTNGRKQKSPLKERSEAGLGFESVFLSLSSSSARERHVLLWLDAYARLHAANGHGRNERDGLQSHGGQRHSVQPLPYGASPPARGARQRSNGAHGMDGVHEMVPLPWVFLPECGLRQAISLKYIQ
jgi:hypothetical protein